MNWWPNVAPLITERDDMIVCVLRGMSVDNWKSWRDGLLQFIEPDNHIIGLLRKMSPETWVKHRDAIYKAMGIHEPAVAGPLHTSSGDLEVVEYGDPNEAERADEPLKWKPDQAAARTIFEMGNYAENHMTKFEAILWHLIGKEIESEMQFPTTDLQGKCPSTVPLEMWAAACRGDAKALREANRRCPGCIYHDFRVFRHIHRHTVLAARSPHPELAFESREWLKTAVLPFVSYSRRGGAKETPRAELGVPHLVVFWKLYRDIVLVRKVASRITSRLIPRLLATFAELRELQGKTAAGVNRHDWGKLIAGYNLGNTEETELSIVDPRKAALRILADVTGFQERHVYQRLLEINNGDLKSRLPAIRAEAIQLASTIST